MGHQLFGVGQLHDVALVDDGDAVGDVAHDGEVMGDEEIGDAALFLHMAQKVQNLGADGHIQCRDGLVSDDEFRLHDESPGDADALALAARELVGEAGRKLGQQAHIQQRLTDFFVPLGGGEVWPDIHQALAYDVAHLGALVQGGLGVLEYHLNFLDDLLVQRVGDLAVYLLALIEHLAARGGQDAHDGPANGGLARTGLAHQTEGLALIDGEVCVLDGLVSLAAGAVGHFEVFYLDQNFAFVCHVICPPLAASAQRRAVLSWVRGGREARSWPDGSC